MPVLDNARHERFAQEVAQGASQIDAYVAAGYEPIEPNASRLIRNAKVAARIAELKEAAAEKAGVTQAYVLSSIVDTMERCKQAVPVLDRKGQPVMVETPAGEVVPAYTFMPASILKGSELLGKHLGMFTEKHEHSGPDGGPIPLPDSDLARLIVFQLTKASEGA